MSMKFCDENKKVKDFNIGEKVYLYICPMYHRDKEIIKETTVLSIGRKYLITSYDRKMNFEESDWLEFGLVDKSDTTSRYYLFRTMQDYKDWKEKIRLKNYLRDTFQYGTSLSLDILREICKIIGGDNGRSD